MMAVVDTRLPRVPTPERVTVTTPFRVKSHGGHCGWQHWWLFRRHSSDTLAAVRFAWRTWHGRSVIGVDDDDVVVVDDVVDVVVVDVIVDVIVVDVVGVSEVVVGVVDSNVVDESVDVVVVLESVVEVVGSIEVAVVDVVVVVVVVVVTGVVVVIITGSCLKRSIKKL